MFLSAEGQSPFVTPTSNQWCPSESRTTSREASMTRQPLTLVFRHGWQFIRGLTRATFLPWLVRVTQTLGEGILRFRTASCLLVNLGEAAACNDLLLTASEGTDFMETSASLAAGCYSLYPPHWPLQLFFFSNAQNCLWTRSTSSQSVAEHHFWGLCAHSSCTDCHTRWDSMLQRC